MQQTNQIDELLKLLTYPAFSVHDGTVTHVNSAAYQRQISPGTEIAHLLHTGKDAYDAFTDGRLHLQLCVADTVWNASVTKAMGADIFLLENTADSQELRILSLAALQFRFPLAEIALLTDKLFNDEALKGSDIPERLNRSLMTMQRLIGNMSDAPRYSRNANCAMQNRDIVAFIEEILEKCKALAEESGYKLELIIPVRELFVSFSPERLERAIYNMLSNALKFSPVGSTITAKLEKCKDVVMFTVSDEGPGLPENVTGNIFTRYLREPVIEDSRFGMGLGMMLVCATASAHGGTVLVRQPKGKGLSVTMTLLAKPGNPGDIRSNIIHVDYSGGHDHALLELSDALSPELYKK
ncbi:MAG: HAMP domain-containing histidine kinase [Ruminococcaceae bacterium]|nr:HAMP domain-containing histidine kinase [Oscillospiraceae bacterium]